MLLASWQSGLFYIIELIVCNGIPLQRLNLLPQDRCDGSLFIDQDGTKHPPKNGEK